MLIHSALLWTSKVYNCTIHDRIDVVFNKVIRKVRKRRDEISKNRKKKYTGLQGGMKLSLAANLVLNWVCPVLSFPERLQPITAATMCTVTITLHAFNPESQYFILLFNKISWLCRKQPGGNEAPSEGSNSGPRGHDFLDNSDITKLLKILELSGK